MEDGLINTQDNINAIKYTVNAHQVASDGTWVKLVKENNEGTQVSSSPAMIIRGLEEWAPPWSNFNFQISAYPAGSYGHSVDVAGDDDAIINPVTTTVSYPMGLRTGVSANFISEVLVRMRTTSLRQQLIVWCLVAGLLVKL